jgi:hypothetical protein
LLHGILSDTFGRASAGVAVSFSKLTGCLLFCVEAIKAAAMGEDFKHQDVGK